MPVDTHTAIFPFPGIIFPRDKTGVIPVKVPHPYSVYSSTAARPATCFSATRVPPRSFGTVRTGARPAASRTATAVIEKNRDRAFRGPDRVQDLPPSGPDRSTGRQPRRALLVTVEKDTRP